MGDIENKSDNQITKNNSDVWLYIIFGLFLCSDIYTYLTGEIVYKSTWGSRLITYLIWFLISRKFHHLMWNKIPNFVSAILGSIFGFFIMLITFLIIMRVLGLPY